MPFQQSFINDLGLRDAGFVIAWFLAIILLIPIQLASMITFDETGLDTLVPGIVFMAVVPALVLTLLPTLVARRFYTRGMSRATAVIGFAVFAAIAAYTMQLYRICGPGC